MKVPQEMQVIEIPEPGGPDALVAGTRLVPTPEGVQVLIKVLAAGINRPDVIQRQGHYPPPPGACDIPGLEVAGEIVALGDKAGRWQVGDEVCALVNGGGYAEYCLAHESHVLPVPQGYSFVQAAALPETFFTVWSNVFDRGGLKRGESFLVHGGSSGIGTTAIQVAHHFGATVFATAGSDEKCAVCRKLGADYAINYTSQDFVEVIKAAAPHGIDVTLDMVGGDYIARNIKVAARDGRIINIAYLAGSKVEVNFMAVMLKRLSLTGSTLRVRSDAYKTLLCNQLREQVWPLLADGTIAPVIDSTFALVDAAGAHRRMEQGGHIGKIMLNLAS